MSYCVELVRFTVADADVDTFLERRQEAIQEVKAAHPALWSVPLCSRRTDGTWIDVWIYETEDAADAANADVENLPKFLAMAALIDNVEIEATEMPTGAVSPIRPPTAPSPIHLPASR
ncbi:hypothetical protein [Rhodococcus koreensis]